MGAGQPLGKGESVGEGEDSSEVELGVGDSE